MALTVVSVAYPLAAVGADAVGGAEQVLALIDRALVREGHRSIVVACAGSRVAGELVSIPARGGPLDEETRRRAQRDTLEILEAVLRRERPDLVHFHGIDFAEYLPASCRRALATLHLPPGWYPPEVFALPERGVRLQCVSESQRKACPPGAEIAEVIPNGVPLEGLTPGRGPRRNLVALGRICPEKGFHLALEAARASGRSLLLAGQVFGYEAHRRYFDEEIAPRLDRRRRFIGPVGFERKRHLLGSARALLVPSLAPETSSLVAMEAMACGAPVIAFRSGALPEVVEDGVTGFLVDDAGGMAEAIERVGELDPRACRARAEARFSADRMTGRYLQLYEAIAGEDRRRARTPSVRVELLESPAELERLRVEWTALWQRDPQATPFSHPDWILPWCRHFGRRRVHSFAVWQGEALAGLAPMEVWPEGRLRVLKLLGAGVSDQLDVVTAPEGDALVRQVLKSVFADGEGEWDTWELGPLRHDSRWAADGGARAVDVSPVLELPRSVEALGSVVPSRLLSNVRYGRRRLEREGPLRLVTAGAAEVDGLVEALFALHRARWRTRGEDGVLADGRVAAFHRDVARRLHRAGLLRLHALLHRERTIAVLYGLAAHGRFHYYLSGFDPAYEKSSPGSLIVAAAIEEAIRRGDRVFDFLRGAEPYKYAWGARDRPIWTRSAGQPWTQPGEVGA